MKRSVLVLMFVLSWVLPAVAAEPTALFGPTQYDVKERYGLNNAYTGNFNAGGGLHLIQLKMGNEVYERPEYLELFVNGEKVLSYDRYDFFTVACILQLKKENTFQISVKDSAPAGFKRPPLPPRFVTLTVLPYSGKLPQGAYGVTSGEGLNELSSQLQKITNPASASLAVGSVDLRRDAAARAESMRNLSAAKDMSTLPFVSAVFNNVMNNADVRGEAAMALGLLGDKSSISLLMSGIMESEEKPRMGAARGLSFYKEEDTREPLIKLLERLDNMRRDAVISAIVNAGWKPVPALMTLAESPDAHIANIAIPILGSTKDPRAADLLLKLLADPGQRDVRIIISALGETGDKRGYEPLMAIATDPKRRAGKEVELADALADIGDVRAAGVISEMSKGVQTRVVRVQLRHAYKRLTGKDDK